jgi:putative transposase
MSWVQIWVHVVFSTKNRFTFLKSPKIRSEVFHHIKENAKEKDIWIDCVNGSSEHAHCLLLLGKEMSISKTVQLIKGESSYWINKSGLLNRKFEWQDDYWAVSVSKSHVDQVREYIYNQEEHHRRVTFKEEVEQFMEKYGWQYIQS